ncbi:MAG: TrkA family potassium uptake protein [Oscillospiraceae bacterium]|nr:TrkA family potassium uptake protein [Oscillospiraceae bacterium]
MKRKQNKKLLYGIIGLGRFGFALAKELAANDCELIVVDKDEDKVNNAAAFTDNAHIVGALTKESLQQAGIHECDVVIIGIAEQIDVCILTTLHVKRFGVKRVIVKATSAEQGDILSMMGAEVVYPERDMAIRLANKLLAPNLLEYIELSDDINIIEIEVTDKIAGQSILSLNVRKNYQLNIVAIKHDDKVLIDFQPSFQLSQGDTITVIGRKENIIRFESLL